MSDSYIQSQIIKKMKKFDKEGKLIYVSIEEALEQIISETKLVNPYVCGCAMGFLSNIRENK